MPFICFFNFPLTRGRHSARNSGAGIYQDFGCDNLIIDCEIVGNTIHSNGTENAKGIGIHSLQEIKIENCRIVRNTAPTNRTCFGGGVCMETSGVLRNSVINSNSIAGSGGGIALSFHDQVKIENCIIEYNEAVGELGNAGGIAIDYFPSIGTEKKSAAFCVYDSS